MVEDFFGKRIFQSPSVEQEEAAARGAAMIGEILSGSSQDEGCPVVEVAPLSIGIETSGEPS